MAGSSGKSHSKIIVSLLLIVALIATGCTVNRVYNYQIDDFDRLNRKIRGRKVQMNFQDNSEITADNIIILPDSVFSIKDPDHIVGVCSTDSLKSIKIRTHTKSAAASILPGLLVGGIFSRVVVKEHYSRESNSYGAKIFVFMFAFLCAVIGSLAGAARGGEDEYIITDGLIDYSYSDLDQKITLAYGKILKGRIISIDSENFYLERGKKLIILNKNMVYKIVYRNLDLTRKIRSLSYETEIDQLKYKKVEIIDK